MFMGQEMRPATASGMMSASNSVREDREKEYLKISGQISVVFLRPIKGFQVGESFFQETQIQQKHVGTRVPALQQAMNA